MLIFEDMLSSPNRVVGGRDDDHESVIDGGHDARPRAHAVEPDSS
jgi:hypothetical protein